VLLYEILRDQSADSKGLRILRSNTKLLEITVQNADEQLFWIGRHGNILYANESACHGLGYAQEQLMDISFYEIDESLSRTKWIGFWSSIKQEGKKNYETVYKKSNGEKIPVEVTINHHKIFDKEFLTVFCHDISERKITETQLEKALLNYEDALLETQSLNENLTNEIQERKTIEKELVEARQQAESANRAKSEFLANMSHEIRTPLNAVLGFAELLKERLADQPQVMDYVESINTGGRSLLGLINDILDLSKIEAGRIEIHKEPINPRKIFEEVKQIFSQKIHSKGLVLDMQLDNNMPEALELDHTRIRQILFNLVGNAIKFTSEGKITITAITHGKPKPGNLIDFTFEVSDTGLGIPRKQQRIIFDAFRQQEGQSTQKYGGTGLGLTITKRLVEIMNGEISVESKIAKGSTFRVLLSKVKVVEPMEEERITPTHILQQVIFKGSKVLLAEDKLSNQKLFHAFLASYNLEIINATDGQAAVEMCHKHNPEIIFMDLRMPVMDGFEAAKIIRRDIQSKHIPIVALSASLFKNYHPDEVHLFNDILQKPVSKHGIVNTLIKYLPYDTDIEKTEDTMLFAGDGADDEIVNIFSSKNDDNTFNETYKKTIIPKVAELLEFVDIDAANSLVTDLQALGDKFAMPELIKFAERFKQCLSAYQTSKIENMLNILLQHK
jgi:PAS domain S-box-containing protein